MAHSLTIHSLQVIYYPQRITFGELANVLITSDAFWINGNWVYLCFQSWLKSRPTSEHISENKMSTANTKSGKLNCKYNVLVAEI